MTLVPVALCAEIAGASVRATQRRFRQIARGGAQTWRGHPIEVELLHGIGGAGGISYFVRLDSLPPFIRDEAKLRFTAQIDEPRPIDGPSVEATRRFHIIASIIAHERGTPEHRAATKAVLKAYPALTERTLQRFLKSYNERGIAGLMPKVRCDKGVQRAFISRLWFEQVREQLDAAVIDKIDRELSMRIRSQYVARESAKYILDSAGRELRKLTIAAGFVITNKTPKRMFDVPRAYMLRQRIWQKGGTKQLDAKAWNDMTPAIRRKLADRPLQVVDIDAMHFDHIVLRPDGTPAYPKAIVYTDRATHQATIHCFLLGPGEGLTQRHVAQSVARFFEERGVPETIYIDNGGEFGALTDLSDIIQCAAQVHSLDGRRPLVNARAYGARSKVVETIIGVLQRAWFAGLPGHVGNNRINRITQQVGRPTKPFPGTFEEFAAAIELRVRMYNASAQRGKLKNRSPDEMLQSHIDNGFERYSVDRASLFLAFSTRDTRVVKPRGIEVAGDWWRCPEIDYRSGETIGILRGRFYDWPVIPLYDLAAPQTIIGYAERHAEVDGMDPANAKEQGRRQKRYNQRGRELIESAAPYDPIADTHESAAMLPPPPSVPIAGHIVPNAKAAEIVANVTEHPATRAAKRRARDQQEQVSDNQRTSRALQRLQRLPT